MPEGILPWNPMKLKALFSKNISGVDLHATSTFAQGFAVVYFRPTIHAWIAHPTDLFWYVRDSVTPSVLLLQLDQVPGRVFDSDNIRQPHSMTDGYSVCGESRAEIQPGKSKQFSAISDRNWKDRQQDRKIRLKFPS